MPPDPPRADRRTPVAGEIYVEFLRQGNAVRATAIDAASGFEASVLGPRNAYEGDLERLAVAKLRRRLERREARQNKTPPGRGRGIVV